MIFFFIFTIFQEYSTNLLIFWPKEGRRRKRGVIVSICFEFCNFKDDFYDYSEFLLTKKERDWDYFRNIFHNFSKWDILKSISYDLVSTWLEKFDRNCSSIVCTLHTYMWSRWIRPKYWKSVLIGYISVDHFEFRKYSSLIRVGKCPDLNNHLFWKFRPKCCQLVNIGSINLCMRVKNRFRTASACIRDFMLKISYVRGRYLKWWLIDYRFQVCIGHIY